MLQHDERMFILEVQTYAREVSLQHHRCCQITDHEDDVGFPRTFTAKESGEDLDFVQMFPVMPPHVFPRERPEWAIVRQNEFEEAAEIIPQSAPRGSAS